MKEFFKGWRRKTGCVALVLAGLIAAVWVRSSFTGDYLSLVIGKSKLAILSQQGKISAARFPPSTKSDAVEPESGWWVVKLPATELKFIHYESAVPYWVLVFALSLLSAFLILIKPKPHITKSTANTNKTAQIDKKQKRRKKRSR